MTEPSVGLLVVRVWWLTDCSGLFVSSGPVPVLPCAAAVPSSRGMCSTSSMQPGQTHVVTPHDHSTTSSATPTTPISTCYLATAPSRHQVSPLSDTQRTTSCRHTQQHPAACTLLSPPPPPPPPLPQASCAGLKLSHAAPRALTQQCQSAHLKSVYSNNKQQHTIVRVVNSINNQT